MAIKEAGWYVVKPKGLMEREFEMEKVMPWHRVVYIDNRSLMWLNRNRCYMIIEEMVLGPYFEWGEEMAVLSEHSSKWETDYFAYYNTGIESRNRVVATSSLCYKKARKIKSKNKNDNMVTVDIDGRQTKIELTGEQIERIKKDIFND